MEVGDLLLELFGRVREHVEAITADLDDEAMLTAPEGGANTVAWLVWHLTRVQDGHIAEILDSDQIWVEQGWGPRFGLDSDPSNTGYGHRPDEVAAVRPDGAGVLASYHAAVDARTRSFLESTTAADLDRVVDRRWDPPVTLGVRLVSIADDAIQHAGQAAYVKGLLARR